MKLFLCMLHDNRQSQKNIFFMFNLAFSTLTYFYMAYYLTSGFPPDIYCIFFHERDSCQPGDYI